MSKINLPLRNASDFYTIPLQADDTLTQVALQNCLDKKVLKKAGWFYPQLKLLSFKDGTTEIENKLDKTVYIRTGASLPSEMDDLCLYKYAGL